MIVLKLIWINQVQKIMLLGLFPYSMLPALQKEHLKRMSPKVQVLSNIGLLLPCVYLSVKASLWAKLRAPLVRHYNRVQIIEAVSHLELPMCLPPEVADNLCGQGQKSTLQGHGISDT